MMYYDATGKDEIARHSGTDMRNLGFAPLGVAAAVKAAPSKTADKDASTTEYDIGENIPELEKKTGGAKFSPTGTVFGEGSAKAKVNKGGTVNVIDVGPWQNYVLNPPIKPVPPKWTIQQIAASVKATGKQPWEGHAPAFGVAGEYNQKLYNIDDPTFAAQAIAYNSIMGFLVKAAQAFVSAASAGKLTFDQYVQLAKDAGVKNGTIIPGTVILTWDGPPSPFGTEHWYWTAKRASDFADSVKVVTAPAAAMGATVAAALPKVPFTYTPKVVDTGLTVLADWYNQTAVSSDTPDAAAINDALLQAAKSGEKFVPAKMSVDEFAVKASTYRGFGIGAMWTAAKAQKFAAWAASGPAAVTTTPPTTTPPVPVDEAAAQVAKLVTEAMGYFTALKTKGAMTDADNDALIKQFGGPVWTVETATKYRDALKAKYDASLVAPAAAPAPAPAPVYGGGGGGGGGGGFEPSFGVAPPEGAPAVAPPVTLPAPPPAKSALPLLALLGAGAWALFKK